MQDPDQFGQLVCHRPGVRPPCPVDISAQSCGKGEPNRAGQPPGPVEAVHDDCGPDRRVGSAVARSEKISSAAGSVRFGVTGTGSCRSVWENSSDDSIRLSLSGATTAHVVEASDG